VVHQLHQAEAVLQRLGPVVLLEYVVEAPQPEAAEELQLPLQSKYRPYQQD